MAQFFLGSKTPELYCMSCLDEEKHNLDVIRFCFMLIYVILNCKCTKMIGSEAAGMEIDGRSSACMAAKGENI